MRKVKKIFIYQSPMIYVVYIRMILERRDILIGKKRWTTDRRNRCKIRMNDSFRMAFIAANQEFDAVCLP